MRRVLTVSLSALLVAACGGAGAEPPRGESAPGARTEPGVVVVDFEDGISKAEVDALEQDWGIDLEFNSVEGEEDGITTGRFAGDLATLLARIRKNPAVEAAEPMYLYEAMWHPDDPDYRYQWHLQKVNAEAAWDVSRGRGVTVAVIDTGIAYRDYGKRFKQVEDLKGARFADGWDFVHDRKEALDDNGHGTHVAGTIAQVTNNGVGVAGLANEATLMPLKVLTAGGFGNSADIADAVRWAADHGAKVINMSLGGGAYSHVMARAVRYARDKGVVVVAAAGNAGVGRVSYPAAYPGVVAVSATRFDDALAPYSSWGPQVDLAAPGGDKTVDQNGDGQPDGVLQNTIVRGDPTQGAYEWFQGTSMATPHVAAAAALVMATGVTDPDDVEAALFDSARKVHGRTGRDDKYGHGVLDAAGAVGEATTRTGLWRTFWAAIVALLLLLRRGRMPRPIRAGAAFLVPLVLTGVGLFFLPAIVPHFPGLGVLSAPLMDWGLFAFGASAHANPLTWSALVPFVLALLLFQNRRLRPVLAGIAAGTAAFLLQGLFSAQADVVFLPGRFLDAIWLLVNALGAFLLAWALTRKEAAGA